jgi:hyperosmotically inducible periplasmic protein
MMEGVASGRRPAAHNEEVTMRLRVLSLLSCLVLLVATAPAAAAENDRSPAAKDRPDAWVAAKARVVLWTDNDVEGSDIDVDVKDGVVTLSGSAGTKAAKAEAERRIKALDGVKQVRNLVQIVPPAKKEAVKHADNTVRTAVEAKLKTDPALKDVAVDNVTAGLVLLKGKATLEQAAQAIKLARGVPGVKRVASQIESPQS